MWVDLNTLNAMEPETNISGRFAFQQFSIGSQNPNQSIDSRLTLIGRAMSDNEELK